ncbi:MAG: glutamine amidotransferase-related protein [Gammaproteobacteria bacterium]
MRRLLVCQHVAHEILGILDPLLRTAGFRIRYVNFGRQPDARPDMARYDGLILLGGPMNCDQVERYPHLATEVDLAQAAIQQGKPVLGICLGSQILARALGARVHRNPVKEIGWYPLQPTAAAETDPLFRLLADSQPIFQWHGDTFEIPEHAVHLASSPDCPHQAFRYGDNVYGLQFHLEVDEAMIDRWLHAPVNMRELDAMGDGETRVASIKAATPELIQQSVTLGRRLFGEYLRLFHARSRRLTLPSR